MYHLGVFAQACSYYYSIKVDTQRIIFIKLLKNCKARLSSIFIQKDKRGGKRRACQDIPLSR